MARPQVGRHNAHMLDVDQLKPQDLQGLDAETATKIATLMLQHIGTISAEHAKQIAERDQEIKHKEAKLQKITFELARLKAWKFGAKTEAMSAEQRKDSRGLFGGNSCCAESARITQLKHDE